MDNFLRSWRSKSCYFRGDNISLIKAFLQGDGTCPVIRDVLMVFGIAGISSSRHSFIKFGGRQSNSQDFEDCSKITS